MRAAQAKITVRTDRLAEAIASRNWTHTRASRVLDISRTYLHMIMSGERVPGPQVRERIQAVFQLSFDGIFYLLPQSRCRNRGQRVSRKRNSLSRKRPQQQNSLDGTRI